MSSTSYEDMPHLEDEEALGWFSDDNNISNATAKLDELAFETVKNKSSSSKKSANTQTTLGSARVFYYTSSGKKVSFGTVADRSKLAHFSLLARDQLIKVDPRSGKTVNMGNQREVTLGRLDHDAGLLVLKYINENNIHHPKLFTMDLLPADSTLAFRCKVFHACNAFRIVHQLRGEEIRNNLCFEFRKLDVITLADFQLVCEYTYFDNGLMNIMQNKVAYHTFRGWITEHELACIWEYVTEYDAEKKTNCVERIGAIFKELQDRAAAEGKVFKSGWCAEGKAARQCTVADSSMEELSKWYGMEPSTAVKTPVTSTQGAAHGKGARGHTATTNQPEDENSTFLLSNTRGPSQGLSSIPKITPIRRPGKSRFISASASRPWNMPDSPAPSSDSDKSNTPASENGPAKKLYSNAGDKVGAIEAAPGFSMTKGEDKVAVPKVSVPKVAVPKVAVPKVAVPKVATPKVALPKPAVTDQQKQTDKKDKKEHSKVDEEDKDKKEHSKGDGEGNGTGKENVPPTQTLSSASPAKLSYAQMLSS